MRHVLTIFLLTGLAWAEAPDTGSVSFYEQIRPVLQANCMGCHQPSKDKGEYVMTDHESLLKGGESGEAAIVPGKPDHSLIMDLIVPRDGQAEMPPPRSSDGPLHEAEIELIRQWIAQGAKDDTPESARLRYTRESPPVYVQAPLVSTLDVSPDGEWLAVAGYHEVLLHKADGSGLEDRLVGLAARVESVAFSPDGKRLAVAGGLPARMGEVQLWDMTKKRLTASLPFTFDTLYGVSWSDDGAKVAFAGTDSSVRVIDAKSGKQIFTNSSHDDWALDTAFSKDGDHLVSVGRDMTVKSYKVETERFIDNITSITPKALKGGVNAVVRHPLRDEVVVGGADGMPKLYRIHRVKKREIGDDSNLLLEFPVQPGRIFDLAINTNGTRVASVSSLDGKGSLRVYSLASKWEAPKAVNDVLLMPTHKRNAEHKKQLAEFFKISVKTVMDVEVPTGLYSVAMDQAGKRVFAGGADGQVRIYELDSGKILKTFPVIEPGKSHAKQ